jgi:hypothetical protein
LITQTKSTNVLDAKIKIEGGFLPHFDGEEQA